MKKLIFTTFAAFMLISVVFAGSLIVGVPFDHTGIPGVTGGSADIFTEKPQQVFRVYPNPVRDDIKVVYDLKETCTVNLEIRDITGKKVMEEIFDNLDGNSEITLGLSALHEGIYFLKFYTSDNKLYQIIKIQKL